jgi:hypothetical protein
VLRPLLDSSAGTWCTGAVCRGATTAFDAGPPSGRRSNLASPLVPGLPAAAHVNGVAMVVVPHDDGFVAS